jgi:hypothetical protein
MRPSKKKFVSKIRENIGTHRALGNISLYVEDREIIRTSDDRLVLNGGGLEP